MRLTKKIIFSVSIHLHTDGKKCVTFSSLVRCLSGSVISCLTKATYAMKSCSAAAQRHTNSFRKVYVFELSLNQPLTSYLPVRGSQHSLSWSISWPGRQASLLWRSRPECRLPARPESSPSPGDPNKQRGAAMNSLEDKGCQTEATFTESTHLYTYLCGTDLKWKEQLFCV